MTQSSDTIGNLGEKLLVAVTRVETKIDSLSDYTKKIEVRVDGIEAKVESRLDGIDHRIDTRFDGIEKRILVVEQRQSKDESYNSGVEIGKKTVLSWVSFAWAAFYGIIIAVISAAAKHFLP